MIEIHERDREVPVERQGEENEDSERDHGIKKDLSPLEDVEAGVAQERDVDVVAQGQ